MVRSAGLRQSFVKQRFPGDGQFRVSLRFFRLLRGRRHNGSPNGYGGRRRGKNPGNVHTVPAGKMFQACQGEAFKLLTEAANQGLDNFCFREVLGKCLRLYRALYHLRQAGSS